MPDKIKNISTSVRQRLKTLSDKKEWDYQIVLRRYVLERILYRLASSEFQGEFVLKGAKLQAVWLENPYRHTRDLDLHARGEEDAARVQTAFEAILATEVPMVVLHSTTKTLLPGQSVKISPMAVSA